MKRREFIGLVGGAAAAWPHAAGAQQAEMLVVGFLSSRSADESKLLVRAFWDGLKEIAASRGTTLWGLIGEIDTDRHGSNLSSAIRLFVLGYFRSRATSGEVVVRAGELADITWPSRHVAGLG